MTFRTEHGRPTGLGRIRDNRTRRWPSWASPAWWCYRRPWSKWATWTKTSRAHSTVGIWTTAWPSGSPRWPAYKCWGTCPVSCARHRSRRGSSWRSSRRARLSTSPSRCPGTWCRTAACSTGHALPASSPAPGDARAAWPLGPYTPSGTGSPTRWPAWCRGTAPATPGRRTRNSRCGTAAGACHSSRTTRAPCLSRPPISSPGCSATATATTPAWRAHRTPKYNTCIVHVLQYSSRRTYRDSVAYPGYFQGKGLR